MTAVSELEFKTIRAGNRRDNAVPLLRIEHLTVRVGIRRVIEALSLNVFEGDAICITGPNGSGKSTLLNAIAGLDPARVGTGLICLAGEDIAGLPPHERSRRGLAFMRQRENVFADLTIEQNLRLALGPDGLTMFCSHFPEWVGDLPGHKLASLLSGGQKQRLAWGMASLRPHILLLADEPEAGTAGHSILPPGTLLLVSHALESWTEMKR
jgi:branched-chain amino acid transport system ATP-binding protein